MPFQMVHLSIAYNILLAAPQIKNKGDFMLGALAPDSVHFRDNYDSGMKKASHLCVGGEKWGRTTNDDEASVYHREANAVDYALYLLHPNREEIWQMVEKTAGYDIPNVVAADEIDKMKKHVLYGQFRDREAEWLATNKYVTVSGMQEFIAEESQYIRNALFSGNAAES